MRLTVASGVHKLCCSGHASLRKESRVLRSGKGYRGFPVVMLLLVCATVVGCKGTAPAEKAEAEKAIVVNPMNPPSGYVLEVKYNGDCLVDIGTEVGVANGDWLTVMRKGEIVQYLKVVNAKPTLSYCQLGTKEEAVKVKVDDRVVLEPKGLENMHGSAGK